MEFFRESCEYVSTMESIKKKKKHLSDHTRVGLGFYFRPRGPVAGAAVQASPACMLHSKPRQKSLERLRQTSGESRWRESRGARRRRVEDARERSKPRSCLRNDHSWLLPSFFFLSVPDFSGVLVHYSEGEFRMSGERLVYRRERKKNAFMTFGKTQNFLLKEPPKEVQRRLPL